MVEWLSDHPSDVRLRAEARAEYEAKDPAETNYRMLVDMCEDAVDAEH